MSPEERAEAATPDLVTLGWEIGEGCFDKDEPEFTERLAAVIRAAVEEERAACLAEAEDRIPFYDGLRAAKWAAAGIAKAIRARGEPEQDASPRVTSLQEPMIPKGGDPFAPEVLSLCEKALALTRLPEDPPSHSTQDESSRGIR